jgi:hypothetical protein
LLVRDATAGDPMGGARWTRKTLRLLAKQLKRRGLAVSHETVRRLLVALNYTLRTNRKRQSKKREPNRDRQMRLIQRTRRRFLQAKRPVISVDTKKKELIGNFKNAGRTWRQGALEVLVTDFLSDADDKAVPFGIYDVAHNTGFVVVGMSHETAAFAVAAIRHWWRRVGRVEYAGQDQLLIEADCGGPNRKGSWLWHAALQTLADEFGLTITVRHLPPSASKWNLIEHRLFSAISDNWAGQPLVDLETLLKFIRSTKTATGLRCLAYLDRTVYAIGLKITDAEYALIRLKRHRIFPDWNYAIHPHPTLGAHEL